MKKKRSENLKRLLLLLLFSFFLHLVFVVTSLRHEFAQKTKSWWKAFTDQLTPAEQKKIDAQFQTKKERVLAALEKIKQETKDSRPAKLTAPISNFGWVMFDDPPQKVAANQQASIPSTMDGSVGEAPIAQATEEEEVPVVKKSEDPFDSLRSLRVRGDISVHGEEAAIADGRLSRHSSELGEERRRISNHEPSPSHGQQTVADRIAQAEKLNEKLASFDQKAADAALAQAELKGESTEKQGAVHVRGAASSKPKRNIIALTKGFIEKQFGQNGTDLVDRDGDPDKRPSLEEMRFLSYESKINWCLQASWKQNFYHTPIHKPLEGKATVEFTLDEHGNLVNCTLLQSTGHQELDDVILKNMKFASPFPPIPKHFGVPTFTTSRIIHVYQDRFRF